MGLLAVMGPSRKDQRGLPAFCATSFSKALVSRQNRRTSCSPATRLGVLGTFSNIKTFPENTGQKHDSIGLARAREWRIRRARGAGHWREFRNALEPTGVGSTIFRNWPVIVFAELTAACRPIPKNRRPDPVIP